MTLIAQNECIILSRGVILKVIRRVDSFSRYSMRNEGMEGLDAVVFGADC